MKIHPFLMTLVASAAISAVVVAGGITAFLAASNEIRVLSDSVIKTDDDILWGPGFGQQHAAYKIKRAVYLRPDMLVLGSSRVTQFRSVMAPAGKRFFNAALAATSLEGARAFLRKLYRRQRPSVVLLGIDPWWFDPARAEGVGAFEFSIRDLAANAVRLAIRPDVLGSVAAGRLDTGPDRLGGRRPVGYLAALNASGFRPDGSWQYGDVLLDMSPINRQRRMGETYRFAFYRNQVTTSSGRFSFVGRPSEDKAAVLRDIIDEAASQRVALILFFPPMAHAVYAAIQETPPQRAYFESLHDTVAQIARDTGTAFLDLHDLAALGVSDDHTLDGLHVDEIGTLAALRRLISANPVLSAFYRETDRAALTRMASEPGAWVGPHRLVP